MDRCIRTRTFELFEHSVGGQACGPKAGDRFVSKIEEWKKLAQGVPALLAKIERLEEEVADMDRARQCEEHLDSIQVIRCTCCNKERQCIF